MRSAGNVALRDPNRKRALAAYLLCKHRESHGDKQNAQYAEQNKPRLLLIFGHDPSRYAGSGLMLKRSGTRSHTVEFRRVLRVQVGAGEK